MQVLLYLLAAVVFMGQKAPAPKQETRATGPGFERLAQAEQLKKAGRLSQAAHKALEAGDLFRQAADWEAWARCYDEAYQCAVAADSADLYRDLAGRFRQAAAVVTKEPGAQPGAKALIWGKMGYLHHRLGEYDLALDCYEHTFPYAEAGPDTAFLMRIYGSAAILYWAQGDDYRALNYHEKALALATAQRDTALMAAITTNLGNVWRTAEPAKAAAAYRQALALDPDNPETLMLLSKAYLEIDKDFGNALQSARASLRAATDDYARADALHQLGRVAFERRQYAEALGYYRRALVFAENSYGAGHPEHAKIHAFIAHALAAGPDAGSALTAYNQTMQELLPLFSPADPHQNPTEAEITATSLWIQEALLGKARVYERLYRQTDRTADLEQALACAEQALAFLHNLKLRYGDDRSKFAMNAQVQNACATALHAALTLHRRTGARAYALRAFAISEQTKGVVLAEALYKREIKQVAGVPPALLEQEREWHEQIAYFESKMTGSEANRWKDSLFYARRGRETLERQLAENYPAYSQALLGYRSTVAADSVRQALPANAALIEYFLSDSVLYTFLLSKDTFWVQEKALPADFAGALSAFRRAAGDWQYTADSSAAASRVLLDSGSRLYEWLLAAPLAVAAQPRLFIVPDGPLHYLPFDLLLTRPYAGQWIDRDVPFLLKEKSVSYRFSCKPNPARRASGGWGGFGTEYDERTLSAIDPPGYPAGQPGALALRNNGRLPYAPGEIRAISAILGGAFWLNEQATRANFLQNAEKYGVLHLAMHGFVDEQNPLRSRLLFSKSAAGEDPFVYASDLYTLQLTAGLAVLSACQSGAGAWKRGEGVMSLARAFAFAGCPSMVMSLWNVSDRSTSELMVTFYQQLKAGKSKDEALQAAKLRYLETVSPEYAKPVYWAGFVPVGEMEALPESYFSDGGWGWKEVAAWGLFSVLVLWCLRVFRRGVF